MDYASGFVTVRVVLLASAHRAEETADVSGHSPREGLYSPESLKVLRSIFARVHIDNYQRTIGEKYKRRFPSGQVGEYRW